MSKLNHVHLGQTMYDLSYVSKWLPWSKPPPPTSSSGCHGVTFTSMSSLFIKHGYTEARHCHVAIT